MATPENQQFGPNKQKFRDNFAATYPDIDMNDEEAYFGALNDENEKNSKNSQRLQELEDSEARLGKAFDADPRTAGLYLELVKEGGKPLDYLIDHYGSEFVDAINDPDNEEFREKIAKKRQEELKRMTESEALNKEAADNLEASLDALTEVGKEMGMTDEQLGDAFNKFMEFTEDLIKDKVSKDWWKIIIKGLNHDADVEDASIKAEVKAKNARIKEKLDREKPSALNTSGGGNVGTGRKIQDLPGALGAPEVPWYKRNMK